MTIRLDIILSLSFSSVFRISVTQTCIVLCSLLFLHPQVILYLACYWFLDDSFVCTVLLVV